MIEDFNLPFVFLSMVIKDDISSFLIIGCDNSNLKELFSSGFEKIFGFELKTFRVTSPLFSEVVDRRVGNLGKHCLKYEYSSFDLVHKSDIDVSGSHRTYWFCPEFIIGFKKI